MPSADSPAATPAQLPAGIDEHSLFRSLFSAYPDALLLVDAQGRIVLANPAAVALLGYSAQELASMSVDALVPDSIRSRHEAYRDAYGKSPRARPMGTQMDLVAKCRDGSEVMVEIALSPLTDQGLPYVVAAIRGIEAYPRVRQALQRARYSEQLAQLGRFAVDTRDQAALLARIPEVASAALEADAAVVFLRDGVQGDFRIAAGVGLGSGEQVGDRLPDRPDTPPGFVAAQARAVQVADFATEQRFVVPPAYLAAGWSSGLAVPLSDRGSVVGTLAVRSRRALRFGDDETRFLESLSSLLVTSLQRAHTEDALNHAQRLEIVGQLTGGIAHDFNNLLTVIQGNLQVLEELPAIAGDTYGQQLVAAATRASRRGAELTGKLLAFSRRQVLQPTGVDAAALLHSLTDMLRRTLDQRIRIDVDVAPRCPPCVADPGQLESALLNIAINARDAMPEGGTLSFAAQACRALPADAAAELGAEARPLDFVSISIRDSGAGMSEATRERAFEPFFTTKELGRGTGLGLSTVYGFAKQSRGTVTLSSTLGEGTVVTLYLPAAAAGPVPELHEPAPQVRVPRGLAVLLVEDDAEVRSVMQTFLDALGCRVSAFASAEQALAALVPGAGFELLLSDIALGAGMRGTALAALASQRLPALGVILMSGFSAELLDAQHDTHPRWELLKKPFGRLELAEAIGRVLANEAPQG
ncbi:MAG: PAS domain S-box protein [Burkholderiaceae bacterium]